MNNKFERNFIITDCQKLMRDAIAVHRSQIESKRFLATERMMGPVFYREKSKLVLSFGRQMGHSTFIAQNANLNDVVVVYNERMKEEWKRYHSFSVITTDQIKRERYKGMGHCCDILWFDGSSVYEKLDYVEYIDLCGYLWPGQVVVLGE